ncbi:TPA: hypothetical protein ACMDPN_002431 [Vibrio cholerae]
MTVPYKINGWMENNSTRVLVNTFVLYFKMFLNVIVVVFTVKILLAAFGVERFGIYTLILGVILIFSFFNSAMTVSTQRFMSISIGQKKVDEVSAVINNSFVLHLILGIIVITLLNLSCEILFVRFLNIPSEYREEAMIFFRLTTIISFFTVLVVPFRALLVSHENILVDSLFSLFQSLLKLISSAFVLWYVDKNELVVFGLLMLVIAIIDFTLYVFYCFRKYNECNLCLSWIRSEKLKEMGYFAGWNLYSNACYALNTQGINVVLNMFFGTLVNAAYGVAFQVNSQLKELSMSLLKAITPQIMKSEGMYDRDRMVRLSLLASKFGVYLVAVAALPSIFTIDYLLKLWLGTVPDYASLFCIYFLIGTMINQLTVGVSPAIQAVGKIQFFQMSTGTIALFTLPVTFILLKLEFPLISIFWVIISTEVLTGIVKILVLSKVCMISRLDYFINVIYRMLVPIFSTTAFLALSDKNYISIYDIVRVFIESTVIYSTLYYFIGLNKAERNVIKNIIFRLAKK